MNAPTPQLLAPPRHRIAALLTAGACLAAMVVAAWFSPAPDGHGTHTQLGLYPCVWAASFDLPCPTCGMTTAFAHAADTNLASAFATQPLGALLAVLTATIFWLSLHQASFGSRIGRMTGGLVQPRVMWVGLALMMGAWIYKIAVW